MARSHALSARVPTRAKDFEGDGAIGSKAGAVVDEQLPTPALAGGAHAFEDQVLGVYDEAAFATNAVERDLLGLVAEVLLFAAECA